MQRRFMQLILIVLLMLLQIARPLSAQDRSTYRWYFGIYAGLNFNTSPPTIMTDGQVDHIEGCSSISDSATGELLFYTDGNTIWNRIHQRMGFDLNTSFRSSTQSSLIVRQPNSKTLYHMFTTEAFENGGPTWLARHYVIDMSLNGGLGGVAASNVTLTPTTVAEKVTACRACNGVDYWIIFRRNGAGNPGFVVYRLTPTGLDPTPITSAVGYEIPSPTSSANRGELKVSPDGKFIACPKDGAPSEVFDFDNSTGVVSNPRVLSLSASRYGLSFSPNSRWLYVNNGWQPGRDSVFRYDMMASNIAASRQHVAVTALKGGLGFMELAPDGRMYITRTASMSLAALTNPDATDPADVGFLDTAITFQTPMTWGLPNFPQDLFIPDIAGPDTTVCPGQAVRIGIPALQGYTYNWTPATGVDDPKRAQPTVTVAQTTTFTVTATDGRGCPIVRDVVVRAHPRPEIRMSVAGSSKICQGESVIVNADLTGAQSYTWQPGNLTGARQEFTPATSQTYRVNIVDSLGCSWVDSIAITVLPLPTVAVSSDTPPSNDTVRVCPETPVQLSASPGLDVYRWSTGDSTVSISVSEAGTYVVEGVDANGCRNSDSIVIALLPSPIANAGSDTSVCAGNALQLSATGGVSYLWTPLEGAPALDRADIATPVFRSSMGGNVAYTVRVTDANGCSSIDTVRIQVTDLPSPSIRPAIADTAICPCGSLTLTADAGQNYEWIRTVTDEIVGTDQQLIVRDSGTYALRISDANGCVGTSAPVTVRFLPQDVTMTVRVPDSAYAGQAVEVTIDATYGNGAILASCPPDSFSIVLSMNRHALGSDDARSSGVVTGDARKVTLRGRAQGSDNFSIRLPYVATLGAVDSSVINIDSVNWQNCPLPVRVVSDTFRLAGICEARGSKRLYNEFSTASIRVQPNPVSNASTIVVDALHDLDGCRLVVVDVLGRVVAHLHDGDLRQGSQSFLFDCADLPDGIYSLVLRTAAKQAVTVLLEVRK